MSKRVVITVGLAAGAILLAACSGASSETPTTAGQNIRPGDTAEVSIENFQFGPGDLTVSVGDTVTWRNDENDVPHTSTADGGLWDSATLRAGDTYSFTFTEPGTYTYLCTIHPSMTATITVNG